MLLSSMVVSRDWQEVSVLECILGSLQMTVAVEKEPQQALDRLSKSKVDALIVDCDLSGTSQLLRELKTPTRTAKSVPLVIMGEPRRVDSLDEAGALFAFEKPICVEQAGRTLSAARNMILDGRLRYHRTDLDVPVSVKCKGKKQKQAQLVNLSQGGMQIITDAAIDSAAELQVSFDLPGSKSSLKAKAEIVWQDQRGNLGVRFLRVPATQQRALHLWLAQQFLAN
jgi:DNA-binding NtrC family response regulator